jgi:hypothetical protein
MKSPDNTEAKNWFSRHNRITTVGVAVVALLVLLVALRVALPQILQRYVNGKLDESPAYAGQVGDIDLFLLAGSYSIENMEINKTSGMVPVPLFAAPEARFSLLWSALLDGAAVGEVELFEPVINIVDSDNAENRQTGQGGPWLTIIEDLFPLRIDKVTIHQGQLHFQNFDAEPPVDIYVSQLDAQVLNLTNSQDLAETMVSRIGLSAMVMEQGELSADMAFDPTLENPTFDLNARLLHLPVTELDTFIAAYAPFDIEAGNVDVVTEFAANGGNLEGYVKPLIHDLQIFEWDEDVEEDNDNPLRVVWEGLVGFVAELLENQQQGQFATIIPITGSIAQPDTGVLVAVINVLKNAFVEALRADLDNTISLGFREEEEDVSLSTEYESEIGGHTEPDRQPALVEESARQQQSAAAEEENPIAVENRTEEESPANVDSPVNN